MTNMAANYDTNKVLDTTLYSKGMHDFFRRARIPNIIGQCGASIATVAFAWDYADHTRLLIYLIVHQCFLLFMTFSFLSPWTNKRLSKDGIPKFGIVSQFLTQLASGSVLWIDFSSASNYTFALTSLIVVYACAAGTMVTLGPVRRLSRHALYCILLPGAIASLLVGHYVLAFGTLFFLAVVATSGVEEMHKAYSELIYLRGQSAEAAKQFKYLANHDTLTKLFNRAGITSEFELHRSEFKSALFIDLDKFKQVNDEAGHSVGDILLQKVSARLTTKVVDLGSLSRIGGDEFLLLLFEMSTKNLQAYAESIITLLEEPFAIEGNKYFISASIGVSLISTETTLENILKESDSAMYTAKRTGRSKVVFLQKDVQSEQDYVSDFEIRRTDWSMTSN